MTRNTRIVLAALGAATAVVGFGLRASPPRLTMLNAAIQVTYPGTHALGAWLVVLGLVVATVALPRKPLRFAGAGLTAVAVYVAVAGGLYRIEANDAGLVAHHVLSETRIAWPHVTHVESAREIIVVQAGTEHEIRIDTADLTADQAAVLDRTIARRVREHAAH